MISLNPEQKKVINSKKCLLIKGGPGSGKTTAGLLKAKHELRNMDNSEKVLFLSFSNSAVSRIRQTAGIRLKKDEISRIRIETFHSFCLSILKSYGGILGLSVPISIYPPEEVSIDAIRYEIDGVARRKHIMRIAAQNGKVAFELFASYITRILLILNRF